MKTYLIAEISITDNDMFDDYLNKIPMFVDKYEGRYLVKGGSPTSIEGTWCPEKIVLIEFPNSTQLTQFLEDSEVQRLFTIRHMSTVSSLVSVTQC